MKGPGEGDPLWSMGEGFGDAGDILELLGYIF